MIVICGLTPSDVGTTLASGRLDRWLSVIGTLAEKAVAGGFDVAIVTMDKDFFQLVDDSTGVRVFNPRDEGIWYDAEGVKTKFGVEPKQVVDVLALMGEDAPPF